MKNQFFILLTDRKSISILEKEHPTSIWKCKIALFFIKKADILKPITLASMIKVGFVNLLFSVDKLKMVLGNFPLLTKCLAVLKRSCATSFMNIGKKVSNDQLHLLAKCKTLR